MRGVEKLGELLERAGLDVVGEHAGNPVLPPETAWRIAHGAAAPAGAALPAQGLPPWPEVVKASGLIDAAGEFLVAVKGHRIGGNDALWTRVRTAGRPGLTGDPAFVALSTDGEVLLGVTPAPDGIRLTLLDRLTERLDAAARTAGTETAEELAAAWATLSGEPAWPGELTEGLGFNRAAPDDVLVRLLDVFDGFLFRDVSPAVREAVVSHPDPSVRRRIVETRNARRLTAAQWAGLVLNEPSGPRRPLLAERAVSYGADLPDEVYDVLVAAPFRAEVTGMAGLPARHRIALAGDPDPQVRAGACQAWPHLPEEVRKRLLADTDAAVRAAALLAHHEQHPMPRPVFEGLPSAEPALRRCRFEPGLEAELVRSGDLATRLALAGNPRLGPEGVAALAEDGEEQIRSLIALHPDLTEERRDAVRWSYDRDRLSHALPWVTALHGDPAAMRRLAASSHPLIRRSVARARSLPADVVQRLARDEDRVVRLFLAESCDDAPADMLLDVWRWWDGSFSHPDRPRGHPNFPRVGLLCHLDDPAPRMRRLALDDPASTPEHVARLARDPAAEVRRRAAEDPRLSPADAVRLLDDPAGAVRHTALLNPRLPARVLVQLLEYRETAGVAVRNPSLPVPVMHRLLDAITERDSL